jgi:hypothetical protein
MVLLDDIEEKIYLPLCDMVLDYDEDSKIVRLFYEAEEHWKNVKLARANQLSKSPE